MWEACALHAALAAPLSTSEHYEEAHGHKVHRRVELYENGAEMPEGWNGIARIVKVRRWGHRGGEAYDEVSYYVLSKPLYHASEVARAIRGHWSIENKLHWSKDVHLGEDKMTLRDKQQVTAMVYFNNMAINIIRINGMKSNKDTYAKIANKIYELIKFFT